MKLRSCLCWAQPCWLTSPPVGRYHAVPCSTLRCAPSLVTSKVDRLFSKARVSANWKGRLLSVLDLIGQIQVDPKVIFIVPPAIPA